MRGRHAVAFAAFATLGTAFARADTVTLDQAVQIALERNADLASKRAAVERPRAELRAARLVLPSDPVISTEKVSDTAFADQGEGSTSLSLSQELDVARRGPRKHEAESKLVAAEHDYESARAELMRKVRAAFFDVLGAERELDLAQQAVVLDDKLLDAAEQRLRAGDIAPLERDMVKVDARVAQGMAIQAEARQRQASADLALLLGQAGGDLSVAGSLPDSVPPLDVDRLVALALERRPDARAQKALVTAAHAGVELARRGYVPTMELALGFTRERSFLDRRDFQGDPAVVSGIDSAGSTDNLLTATVSLRLPLSGHVAADIASRRADLTERESADRAILLTIESQVRAAADRASRHGKSVLMFKELLETVDENVELLRRAYESGQVSLSDYLVQTDRALEAKRSLLDAQRELAAALVDLEWATAGAAFVLSLEPS